MSNVERTTYSKQTMKRPELLLVILIFLIFGFQTGAQELVLSEFQASNQDTLADQDGENSDWIEIHNPAALPANLEGWFLTDSTNNLQKWRFPAVTVGPAEYLLVFASGKNRATAGDELHANFSLAASGEYLALVRSDGTTIVSQYAPTYPAQRPDISYGRQANGEFYFLTPTPGRANHSGVLDFVADTRFSHDRGFYDLPFALEITTRTPGAEIRYTTNGTVPSLTNGLVYMGLIPISGTTVLRAAAFKQGLQPSNVDTHTYFFLDDVLRQSATGQPPPGWPSSWGANTRDYGMDPEVVDSPSYRSTIKEDLKTIPSISVVMNLNDLFNPNTGIYANPRQDGRAWERPSSVELIHPDGSEGFQVNAGIRIRGGYSRSTSNPKHAFRLFLREEYGDDKLRYPLFGERGADEFDNIDLRTFQNYSWSFEGDSRGVFIRDQFSRDTQLDMGHHAERGNYYHLYINGQYWGLYNTAERPEASYGETYFGGDKEDYDVVKVESGPYSVVATDGDLQAWTRLYNLAKAGLGTDAAYQRIQGRNPDGTSNPEYENLLDIPNLIDYMLVILYGGNLDAPISNFLGNTAPNNWYGIRDRNGREGFRFFAHDSEHTLLNVNEDRTGPYPAGDSSVVKSSPQWLWQKLQANAEFRLRVADHVHRHFFNGGALTVPAVTERFLERKMEIDRAVVGESARWGDSKRSTPLTRDRDWVNAVNNILNNYFPRRSDIVLNQLKADGLYPSVAAPSFSQHGGTVSRGYALSMTAPAGVIYFTRNGSDPRLRGGEVAPGAIRYEGPVSLLESGMVKARVLNNGVWSALTEADFSLIQTFTELLITEIHYNPRPDADGNSEDLEFIELKNVSTDEMDLSGVRFTQGISFTFPLGTRLGSGQFMVLASSARHFTNRYPQAPLFGTYQGQLDNSGETIALVHAAGAPIVSVTYQDKTPWPVSADGAGYSLVPVNPNANPDPNLAQHWRAGSQLGGSPGADDAGQVAGRVQINEVLAHTDLPEVDAIELYNPEAQAVDVSGWFLTDDRSRPLKFRLPAGTIIPAGEYRVFTEADFNSTPGAGNSFSLRSTGDEVFLFSADVGGALSGYSDGFPFGASENGVSFGRYTNRVGELLFIAQATPTLGAPNAGPRVGPVVINEIHYRPVGADLEYLELRNITSQPVPLHDPSASTNTWRISGLDFTFPPGQSLGAQGLLLVTAADPARFRQQYSIPASVPVYGPMAGALQDRGERLQILKPDAANLSSNGLEIPWIVVDEIRYRDAAPWPVLSAGQSLERISAVAFGNDPLNWRSSPGSLSPGLENDGNRRPTVSAGIDFTFQVDQFPFTANLVGTARDDGLPQNPGRLALLWRQVSGPAPVLLGSSTALQTTALFPGVGTYVLSLTADDGQYQAVDEVIIRIERAPASRVLSPAGSVWRYLDNGSDQGAAWRAVDFNDSAWASGKAQLGYGDGDEATVIGFGPNGGNKYLTSYFRRAFVLNNPASVTQLRVRLMRDDGAVVYLNGGEALRHNMPEGSEITSNTRASSVVGGGDESTFYEIEIDPALLRAGTNLLAVEIHQTGGNSSDLSFDLELAADVLPANNPPYVRAGEDQVVPVAQEIELAGVAVDDGLPATPGQLTVSWTQVSGPVPVTWSATNQPAVKAQFPVAGEYVLRLTAGDGESSASDDLQITARGETLDQWRARYFTAAQLADPAISGPAADPDGDGLGNQQEYWAGTHPLDTSSVLGFQEALLEPHQLRLRFQAAPGRSYTLQATDAIAGPSWTTITNWPDQNQARVIEYQDRSMQSTSRLYRISTP